MNQPTLPDAKSLIVQGAIMQELGALIASGATQADLDEPAFRELLTDKLVENETLKADPGIVDHILMLGLLASTPAQLRELAASFRAKGHAESAYDLEVCADRKERGVADSEPRD